MSATPLNVPARDETVAGTEVITSKDIIRDAAGTEGTVSLSSERFNFVGLEESDVMDSIDQASQLFAGFSKKPPTLKEALASMGYEKAKELAELFTKKATDKLMGLDAPGLTVEDIAVIFCYTSEWDKKRFGEVDSPYKVLNNSLSVDRSNAALKKTRGILFLLLQALRKLPYFVPEDHTLYRGLKAHVQTETDPEFPGRKPYAAGNEKTWWAFTSTTTSLEATQEFLGDSESTLFVVSGNPRGYDISVFSDFPDEKEILLEPERKLRVTSVFREGQLITVNAEMLDTPHVLKKVVKVSKHAIEIKAKKSKIKEVPKGLKAENTTDSTVDLLWTPVVVKGKEVKYQVVMKKAGFFNRSIETVYEGAESRFTVDNLEQWTEYEFWVRCGYDGGWGKWSEKVTVRTKRLEWKKCPDYIDDYGKYSIDEMNPRTATKVNDDGFCTVIGNAALPHNRVTSWNIKILKSKYSNGNGIFIGVTPFDIDQNEWSNINKCGWYFYCYKSKLYSGPPHCYYGKEYGPRKGRGKYVHTGDSVGVVMDTTKGELSFVVNGVNLGVAYKGIPLDKPLVPCVVLYYESDSVELDTTEVEETKVNSSIPVHSNITAKSITWDSITLSWNAVEGASFYQIEVDGSKTWDASTTNTFTKAGLLADTEHSFRMRAVCGNKASEWSGVVKGRTQKESFEISVWEECPDDVGEKRKYFVDEKNPRTATKIGNDFSYCTIIGNTPLPHSKVTSWNIKILESYNNDGGGIIIGVAPSDINQNEGYNYNKCGWYFYCWDSTLCSGPPHNYRSKEYGPRKGGGQYVHTGDNVGVVMDTAKGELSFVVNDVNLGIAYEGIPLDKPLVPCVHLCRKDDSVELII